MCLKLIGGFLPLFLVSCAGNLQDPPSPSCPYASLIDTMMTNKIFPAMKTMAGKLDSLLPSKYFPLDSNAAGARVSNLTADYSGLISALNSNEYSISNDCSVTLTLGGAAAQNVGVSGTLTSYLEFPVPFMSAACSDYQNGRCVNLGSHVFNFDLTGKTVISIKLKSVSPLAFELTEKGSWNDENLTIGLVPGSELTVIIEGLIGAAAKSYVQTQIDGQILKLNTSLAGDFPATCTSTTDTKTYPSGMKCCTDGTTSCTG